VINFLTWVALAALLFSCTTSEAPDFKIDKAYKFDADIEINGKKGAGFLVVPKSDKYKIKVKAKGNIDLLTVRNCHRSREIEKAFKGNGIFHGKKYVEMKLIPNNPIEQEHCPLDIGAYDKKGRHSFAWVDFYHESLQLSAVLNCNGFNYIEKGVSICQGYAGTFQEIKFPNIALLKAVKPECALNLEPAAHYRYEIKKGVCVYAIMDVTNKQEHRLTTIGYEHIILRE